MAELISVCLGEANLVSDEDTIDYELDYQIFACQNSKLMIEGANYLVNSLTDLKNRKFSSSIEILRDCVDRYPQLSQCWYYLSKLVYADPENIGPERLRALSYISRAISTSRDRPRDYYYLSRATMYASEARLLREDDEMHLTFLTLAATDMTVYLDLSEESISKSDLKLRPQVQALIAEISLKKSNKQHLDAAELDK
ncbi:hypothetical protein [Neogemmobacter tilapiae]|uniref:Tetratricopeptide repeat protein n=1 Tax=Neogemmobacter tilapiae TaxID=875041 RepID=A0A918WQE5_9RHOB|nr:hypothetical protein [Gemmobacter tilapiae]GHC66431.1 hypothetical protein GCM10007315_33960 [Gemmobacter tilapiae]